VLTDHIEQDPAVRALNELVTVLDTCLTELEGARSRAEKLLEERQSGRAWLDIVTAESRPLVVEQISSVMGALASAGGAWRREQAHALASEHVSINRIAAMFGVTRQRISALLRERARGAQALP
jgi:HEAT repeat protein